MKRILIQAGQHPFDVPTAESVLVRNSIRSNVGNLMYTNAAFKHLGVPGVELKVDTVPFRDLQASDADRINDECDAFVIPMANAFKRKFLPNLTRLAGVIRRIKVPVIVFGVGAQSDLDYSTAAIADFNDAVQAFIGAVLDRSATVGVRGEFTRTYLAELGFRDVDVVGCPSIYLRGPNFRLEQPADRSLPAHPRIALSTALRIRDAKANAAVNASLLRQYPDLTYFAQESLDLKTLYWGDDSLVTGEQTLMPETTSHPLIRDADACMPLEPHSWMRELQKYDFAIGSRIHGNIAAIVAGVPALLLAHDSRTRELAEQHHIPYRRVASLPAEADLAALYAEADYSAFNKHYDEGFQRMLDFMSRNGLQNTYEHGDGGAGYDARVAATAFTPPYRQPKRVTAALLRTRSKLLQAEYRALADQAAAQGSDVEKFEAALAARKKSDARLLARLRNRSRWVNHVPGLARVRTTSRGIVKRLRGV